MIEYLDNSETSGIETFDNGDIYEGGFKDGLKHGKGILTTRNNRSYEGDWENDKPHGFGINTFPNGKIYTGNFDKGKPVGDGQECGITLKDYMDFQKNDTIEAFSVTSSERSI